ncbi:Hsp20/alpha crystallin family protein [Fictibacillus sp. KIGAM418]|uniref:Hsp20/alpha crystallin family protein n=1 Tax=Fictibacillus marinisediminis TaxID=2878389 RepID=A0A9X2BFN5_9BACL|nr:Hsp20/alpha crystallin family protein [Fictibacillus marinisediminis]MCK6255703.1 Hsp20/alpha crystallin family protein [Fictibacillus marinisediminis]
MDSWKQMMEWKKFADQYLGQNFFSPYQQQEDTQRQQQSQPQEERGFPAVNIYESENELLCIAAIPGLEKAEDVDVYVDDRCVHLKGKTNLIGGKYRIAKEEFGSGAFSREVELPYRVRSDTIHATYKKGFLYIKLYRLPADRQKPKKVDIRRFDD